MRCTRMGLAMVAVAMAVRIAGADSLSTEGSPSPDATFTIDESFVTGIGEATDMRFLPDGRMVIINKTGTVYVRTSAGSLVVAGSFAVDTESEKGLLGLAVDPAFAQTGRLFFYYSAPNGTGTDADRHRVVSRTLGTDNQLAPGETPLLSGLRGPANHDGGALDVGPDGRLYVGVGDTGCNSNELIEPPYTPTNFYATCLADHPTGNGGGNGKILRIGLDGSIPSDNPLVGATDVTACAAGCGVAISPSTLGPGRDDVFAWGFRNPFRLWVDPQTGNVWVGDVGEISYEELTIARRGRHHGWPWREGAHGHPASTCRDVRIGTATGGAPIQDDDCVDPVYYCRHTDPSLDASVDPGCETITIGHIVDICTWPASFRGRFVFGDFSTGEVWTLAPTAARDGLTGPRRPFLSMDGGGATAFRSGPDGALYVVSYYGRILRIAPRTPVGCSDDCATAVDCDDGEACTTDTCDANAGTCANDPIAGCTATTTTTLPPGVECLAGDPGPCDDDDACNEDVCGVDGRCGHAPVPGSAGVTCLCVELPAACATATLPKSIAVRRARGCELVARADGATAPRGARRLRKRALKLFRHTAAAARRAAPKRLDAACATALDAELQEAAARTTVLLQASTPSK